MTENKVSRRTFLKTSAAAGAAGVIASGGLLTSCGSGGQDPNARRPIREPGTYYVPELLDWAPDGRELKAGVIGCGARGSGAAFNFLNAANGVTIHALGDARMSQANGLARRLEERSGIVVPPERRFDGLDAYKQVIDSGVDVIIEAVPPAFRPDIFAYAVQNNVHCFLEKPICIDPEGYRKVIAASRMATARNLTVVTGTQRHHDRAYVASFQKIMEGWIGEITGGTVYWNQGFLWANGWDTNRSDFENMIADWVNWRWLSGDHIVEQHHHNLDVYTWFTGKRPVRCLGTGARHRRVTGDQYDNFHVAFEMEDGTHMQSMCRQMSGQQGSTYEFIQGTKGSWTSREHVIRDLEGNEIWRYDDAADREKFTQFDPYTLEHVDMICSIRGDRGLNQGEETAISNMAAIMGREAAYSGRRVTWDQMVASPQNLMPEDLSMTGRMDMSTFVVPVPGQPLGRTYAQPPNR